MVRWLYTSKFEHPDRDCTIFAETVDGYALLFYNCDKCTFRDHKGILWPSQEIKRWAYVYEIVMVLDRITNLVSDTETAFRKYLNNNQTDSGLDETINIGTVEMKTGEMSYEV